MKRHNYSMGKKWEREMPKLKNRKDKVIIYKSLVYIEQLKKGSDKKWKPKKNQ